MAIRHAEHTLQIYLVLILTSLYSFKLQWHSSVSMKMSIASVPQISTTVKISPSMLISVPIGSQLQAQSPYSRYLPDDDSCPEPSLHAQQYVVIRHSPKSFHSGVFSLCGIGVALIAVASASAVMLFIILYLPFDVEAE